MSEVEAAPEMGFVDEVKSMFNSGVDWLSTLPDKANSYIDGAQSNLESILNTTRTIDAVGNAIGKDWNTSKSLESASDKLNNISTRAKDMEDRIQRLINILESEKNVKIPKKKKTTSKSNSKAEPQTDREREMERRGTYRKGGPRVLR
jgi:hypothetical protein